MWVSGCCFFLANATVHKAAAAKAATMRASAGLLNSGTFGVEVEPGEVEVLGLDVGAEVGLGVEVPLDESDTTASLPMLPDVEPGLLIA